MRPVKHLFLLNPLAGKYDRTHEVIGKLEAVMEHRALDWEVKVTEYPGHGIEIARAYAASGDPVRIYACGGDGTLNEAVNGAAGWENAAVTHYPIGSGNDFIKVFGPDAPRFYDLPVLLEGPQAPLDLIECNGRYSVNICSVGFDARIGIGMADFKKYPMISGTLAYQLSAVTNLIKGIHRPYHVEVDGEVFDGDFSLLCACNGRCYGGGFKPAPEAMPDDGLLNFLLVKGVSRLTVTTFIQKYARGEAKDMPEIVTLRQGREMKVVCDRESMVNVDGERLDATELSFALSAKKLNFFFPEGAHWNPAYRKEYNVNERNREKKRDYNALDELT